MAQPNIALKPFSGTYKESFREFEHLLRSIIGVAAVAGAQQANFLQLHLRDAALRYFQTLPEATCNDLALSLTALRNHFCNPQLQELHVIKLENVRFDPKTDSPENFLVSLQNMTLKAYPDPIPEAYPPGADQVAQDAVDARNDENLRFAQQERQNQTKRFFKKCMPSWLRAKLLEQPDNTTVEDLCLLARKQLTIHDLCKKEDYIDGAFNEVSPTISDNLINALSKLSQTQESMENRMSALSKQVEEQNKRFDEQKFSQSQNFGNQFRGNGFRGSNRGQMVHITTQTTEVEEIFEAMADREDTEVSITSTTSSHSLLKIISNILLMLHSLRGQRRKTFNRSKNNKQQVMSNQLFKFFNQLRKHMFLLLNIPKSFAISAVIQIIWQLIAQCDHVDAEVEQIFRSNGLQKTR